MYESDLTKFMREFLKEHPEEVESQRAGRAIWWDKHIDREALGEWKKARVPQKPYVYGGFGDSGDQAR